MAEQITVTVVDSQETVVLTVGLPGDMLKSVYDPDDNGQIANAQLENMLANTIKGRITSGGVPQDLTATQVRTIINVASGAIANLVEDTTPQLGGELDLNSHSVGGAAQTATGDGTTTIDWKLGNIMLFQFGAFNETFTFTAPTKPGVYILRLIQDSVGSRTVTWPATAKWIGGTAPTLTTTATTGKDWITFIFDGTNYDGVEAINFS